MANHDPNSEERTLATSYRTGHRPKETLEQLIARCNSGAMLGDIQKLNIAATPKPAKKRGTAKQDKLMNAVLAYTPEQLKLILEISDGDRVLLRVADASYAVKKLPDGSWSICGLDNDTFEYNVDHGKCTCPDSKFRGNECKHIKALARTVGT